MTNDGTRSGISGTRIGRSILMQKEHRLILDSAALGVVGALSAQLFVFMLHWSQKFFLNWIAGYSPPGLPNEGGELLEVIGPHGLWLIPVATTLGGLISGILVYTFAPEAEGHGTDTVVKSWPGSGRKFRGSERGNQQAFSLREIQQTELFWGKKRGEGDRKQ